jgi:hypothetical protein
LSAALNPGGKEREERRRERGEGRIQIISTSLMMMSIHSNATKFTLLYLKNNNIVLRIYSIYWY